MKLRKCILTVDQIVSMYASGSPVSEIQQSSGGISRQAVYNVLKAAGVDKGRREVIDCVCQFCGEQFKKPRSHFKGEYSGKYCSNVCFHASRSLSGSYSNRGGTSYEQMVQELSGKTSTSWRRESRKVLADSGITLTDGQVVHHINGKRWDNRPENLRVFGSQSEHMRFHHQLRTNGRN